MSKKCKGMLVFVSTIMLLQMYSFAAFAEPHFKVNLKQGWTPTATAIMDIEGILTVNNQTRKGDEIAVFFQGTCCGTNEVVRTNGVFSMHIFNYKAFDNVENHGPRPGDKLEVRLWDSQRKVEILPGTGGYVVDVVDSEVKDAAGNLIWKHNEPDENNITRRWRVDISYVPPPMASKVEPDQGYTDQSTSITITGENFSEGVKVKIGSTELSGVKFVNETTLTATVPAGLAVGSYDVIVSVGNISGTLANGFKVLDSIRPQVSMVSPDHGLNDQVNRVLIIGSNLLAGAQVKIAGMSLTNLTYSHDVVIYADIPAGISAGTYAVTVIAPGGVEGTLPNGFTVLPGHEEQLSLRQGLNLIAYPVTVPSAYSSYDFIASYFTSQSLDSLWHYNHDDGQWEITSWDDQGLPTGDPFDIENGEGYLLYAKEGKDLSFPGASASFTPQLYRGMNLVSFNPPSDYYTSYNLLQDMLRAQKDVAALQRYEKDSGRWLVTFSLAGNPAGDSFIIKKDESYVVYMKQDVM